MAARRKVRNPLALAVLATLSERPMHPYEMAAVMRARGQQESIPIKWGTLYTVVENLEKHGFIEATGTVREGRRPERTLYRITDAGGQEMRDWLRELIGTPEKEFRRLAAGLAFLAALPPDEVVDLLGERVRTLEERIAQREVMHGQWRRHLPRLFLVEEEYDLAMLRAEADWTRGLLAEITGGTLPGLAGWRRVTETGELPPEWAELSQWANQREGGPSG